MLRVFSVDCTSGVAAWYIQGDTTPIFCFILSFFPVNDLRANATQSRIQEGARCPVHPTPAGEKAAAGIGHSCSSNFVNVPGLMFLSPETGWQIRRPSVSTTRSLFHHRSDSQVPAMYLFSPRLAHPVQDESCLKKGTK